MTETCPNCAAPLLFNPSNGMLDCKMCGSSFKPEEIKGAEELNQAKADEYKLIGLDETENTESIESENLKTEAELQGEKIYGDPDSEENFYDSSVYICNQCGAEIAVNTTEASTACIYCGCPNIVFDRVSRMRKPTYIIPFKVTKEEAEEKVRSIVKKGFFIPKEIKNFSTDCVRGIYIPYWLTDLNMDLSMEVKGRVGSGKSSHTEYFYRAGKCDFHKLTNDASVTLADMSSAKLEPYDFEDLANFDKNYLAGFYSDIADVEKVDGERLAVDKARELMQEQFMNSIKASNKQIITQDMKRTVNNVESAMLPAWFVTFSYKGTPHTILVNGQTGKVSGAVPWNKGLFIGIFAAICAVFFVAFTLITELWVPAMFGSKSSDSGKLVAMIIAGGIALLIAGIRKITKVMSAIKLTQSQSMFGYVKKRQGDL